MMMMMMMMMMLPMPRILKPQFIDCAGSPASTPDAVAFPAAAAATAADVAHATSANHYLS